jgi:outer membrane receptor for ferrienterochelin and colicin
VGGVTVEADSAGTYMFPSVPAGTGYSVSASASGFRTSKAADIAVVLGRATVVDVKLEVGSITESVVVSATAVMVDTQVSSSAVTVDKTFFDLIPKGRSFYDLVAIAPGARAESKTGGIQVDGASGSENTYYLDGMEVTNMQTGVLDNKNRIPTEMVQQMQVKNGMVEAQYGGAMGGVVSATLQSGSNAFHGQVGFYFDNDNLSARPRDTLDLDHADDMLAKYYPNPIDNYSTWNPMFSVGGPLVKNRLFFYSGYMPSRTTTERSVTFEPSKRTGTFNQTVTQQYWGTKLDFVPSSKIRTNMSWLFNPRHQTGVLPARDGTSNPDVPWGQKGNYGAGQVLTGQIDYLPTAKLILSFRGGYNYSNYNTMYAPSTKTAVYSNANTTPFPELPANLKVASAGWVSGSNADGATKFDIYKRVNLNADVSYFANWLGQHNLKGGWQTNRLSNSPERLDYPNGYWRYYWNNSYACVTSQCSGRVRGTYGYYRYYTYGTTGDASSDNQALFIQDTWRISRNLTLNLGLRTEREFLPSYSKQGVAAAPPIEFSWGDKFSPRVGGAWDPRGDGKMKIYASWGYIYDVMKYEMPRGSFGGDVYWTYFFPLNDPTRMLTNQGYALDNGGKWTGNYPDPVYEGVNWRIPSNDPNNSTVDPNLKPMKQQLFDLGYDYSLSSTTVASVRYTNRRLIRTIEDVGTLGPEGEIYYIANPGEGIVADPKTWEAGMPTTPKAKRLYDALEFRLDKRFSSRYQFAASYTFAKNRGNYSGLASSDENGRTSPNVNRYFDLPWLGYNEKGQFAEGPLATDRPHTFKFFGGYTHTSRLGSTTLSPTFFLFSGLPLTTEVNAVSTTPIYPYDRGNLGRTPVFHNLDLNLMHEFAPFKSNEAMKFRFEFTVFNAFNTAIVTNWHTNMGHSSFGQITFDHDADFFKGFNTSALMTAQEFPLDPRYKMANGFQGPRYARIQLSFFF